MPPSSYLIGVDTGGTYTDCAIIEAQGHRVVARAKAITTKGDLAIGVSEAITQAVAQLPSGLAPQDIGLVSVSTTLATNAVVEGHGSAVAVVLVGFDERMVERTGVAKAFPGVPVIRVAGGHDHNGAVVHPLDLAALELAVDAVADKVDAFAVASTFAVRNAEHEQRVQEWIVTRTGKPVTVSTELSSALDAPRRALTAALNARLIARVSTLIDAVQRAMVTLQIDCPLMIVKGDGTLALAETVARRPIETVLSGPAASLVGAQWLSGQHNFILSDMGGTTTDLGVLQDGRPRITEQGAEVGGWRTMVRAIDVRTIGLGGDSEVHVASDGRISVGPQRVVPVALLGARFPQVISLLQADLDDVERGSSLHGRFVLLPFGARAGRHVAELSPREQELLQLVTEHPKPLRKLVQVPSAQRALANLRRKGLVQIAAMTPSDAAHVLDMQHNWSTPAALMATQLACRLRDMKFPTPERTEIFARDVWSETVRMSARAILDTAFGEHVREDKLVRAVCGGDGTLGLARISVSPTIPVVAVGGPVSVYYGEVGRRLGCQIVFPEYREVANAVGAAIGVVAQTVTVRVDGDGSGGFVLHSTVGTRRFDDPQRALAAATELARQSANDAVVAMGANNPEVRIVIRKQLLPNATSDAGLLEAVVTAEAIGRPNAM
ncbi:MAG: hydantoinase/oxoprolinase family protein [Burkholderiaceae bacterium]